MESQHLSGVGGGGLRPARWFGHVTGPTPHLVPDHPRRTEFELEVIPSIVRSVTAICIGEGNAIPPITHKRLRQEPPSSHSEHDYVMPHTMATAA